jgi:hypothetical protein
MKITRQLLKGGNLVFQTINVSNESPKACMNRNCPSDSDYSISVEGTVIELEAIAAS